MIMDNRKETVNSDENSSNYELKSKAVEDLVSDETPEYSQEELYKYRKKKGFHIPEWLKIVFIKFWFYGAVCYFIVWGLAFYVKGLDMMFVLAVVMGMVMDLLLNNLIRFIEKIPGGNDRWLMVTKKGMVGFGLNLLYGCVLVVCMAMVYAGIFAIADAVQLNIGSEPILFGLLCMGIDMLFIGMKRMLLRIISDARDAASH